LKAAHRARAACFAVLGAAGDGKDPSADAAARTALRRQGLGWLRADLVVRHKQAGSANVSLRDDAAGALNDWLTDAGLKNRQDNIL
jgi:hypothetical protein